MLFGWFYFDWTILIVLPAFFFSLWAQLKVNSTYEKYSKIPTMRGITGADAARRVLNENGLYDVKIENIRGNLTDHYDPRSRVLRLSDNVYGVSSAAAIEEAQAILVFSCGVGVQTVAQQNPGKRVVPGCDTYRLPGFQGVTPLQHDCKQCGECFLNLTGGICPLTACSKSLVNGQCGGAKNGKCEVDPNMECGWERIYQKLKKIGRLDAMKCPVQLRNYATDDQAKA